MVQSYAAHSPDSPKLSIYQRRYSERAPLPLSPDRLYAPDTLNHAKCQRRTGDGTGRRVQEGGLPWSRYMDVPANTESV